MTEEEMEETRLMLNERQLVKDLAQVLNCHSMENGSNTPDFILGKFLVECLKEFDKEVNAEIAVAETYASLQESVNVDVSVPRSQAKFLRGCLAVFLDARTRREVWHGDNGQV